MGKYNGSHRNGRFQRKSGSGQTPHGSGAPNRSRCVQSMHSQSFAHDHSSAKKTYACDNLRDYAGRIAAAARERSRQQDKRRST